MDKILIAPFKHGLKADLVDFLLPNDAFKRLINMIIYEGKIKRRPGASMLDDTDNRGFSSRLRIDIGTTDGAGNLAGTIVPGNPEVGQQFSVDDTVFTVYQANGAMSVSPVGATGTFNTGTGLVTITGTDPFTDVYYYPSTPVIGFATYYEQAGTNVEFAFDLQFAYVYNTTLNGWERIVGGGGLFSSTVQDRITWINFKSGVSGEPALFITNYQDNGLRYYSSTTPTFTNFAPATSAVANYNIRRARYVIDFQGRLLLMNLVEREGLVTDQIEHVNRIRYSAYQDAISADSFYSPPDITTRGGFIDLPAGEYIQCAEILDGRLIVFTEDSIYELLPTGNYIEPFQLALVDDTHGSASREVVEVNNMLMFANNNGIYFYDGRNVNKASTTLDDFYDLYEYRFGTIYKDSSEELIYILTSNTSENSYPNSLLVYNYRNNTFSSILDLYTTMGTLYNSAGGTFVQPIPMAGNHKGYTHIFNPGLYINDSSQSIISMARFDANNVDLKVYNHQLANVYVRVENSLLANFNGAYRITVVDVDTIRITDNGNLVVANYLGDGTLAKIDNIGIWTKSFNPYMSAGHGTSINKISFNVKRTTTNGQISVIATPNSATFEEVDFNFYLGDRKLDTGAYALVPTEASQQNLWHDVYTQSTGESIGVFIVFSEDELLDEELPYQELTINAIMLHVTPAVHF